MNSLCPAAATNMKHGSIVGTESALNMRHVDLEEREDETDLFFPAHTSPSLSNLGIGLGTPFLIH